MRIGPARTRRYYTHSGAPSQTHKISTDIRHMVPPFYRGQNVPYFGQNFDPNHLWTAAFLKSGALSEIQNKLAKDQWTAMIGLSTYQTWGRSVPPALRTVDAMGTQNGKSGKFIIYPPFLRPTPSTPPPMLYHLFGRSCCKKSTVPYFPIRHLHFTGGKNQQPAPV